MWEYIGSWNDPNYMAHSGVKGQKWGVRRYQNEDGSLTPEGRRHYALLAGGTALGAAAAAGVGHYLGGTTQGKLIRGAIGRGNIKGAGRLVGQSLTRTGKAVKRFAQNKINPIDFEAIRNDTKRMRDARLPYKMKKGVGIAYNAVADAPLAGKKLNKKIGFGTRYNATADAPLAYQRHKKPGIGTGYNAVADGPYTFNNVAGKPKAKKVRNSAPYNSIASGPVASGSKAQFKGQVRQTADRLYQNAATYYRQGRDAAVNFYNNNRGAVRGVGAGLGAIGAGAATAGIARSVDKKKSKKRR